MRYAADITQVKEFQSRAAALVALAVSRDSFLYENTDRAFRSKGWGRYVKSTDPILGSDPGVNEAPLRSALLTQITAQSLDGRIDGALRLPITTTVRLMVGTIVANTVGEAAPKPVGRLDFALAGREPTKVVAEIVLSAAALRAVDEATQAGIAAKLVSACVEATDAAFVEALTTGSPTSGSVGDLLAAISNGSPRQPYLVGGFDSILGLPVGTIRDLQAIGVTILTSPAAAGLLIAVDSVGLLISEGDIEVTTARHATVSLGGSPSVPDLNLWQADMTAVRAERFMRFAVREGAVAFASTGSA